MNKRLVEGLADAMRPGWRERRAKQKSLWDKACVLVGFGLGTALFLGLIEGVRKFNALVFQDNLLARQLGDAHPPVLVLVSILFMMLPLLVPALVLGFLASNCFFWCIPPARRTMEQEAAGDTHLTFAGANAELIRKGAIASAISIALCLAGTVALRFLG